MNTIMGNREPSSAGSRAVANFKETYGKSPQWISSAPGRVNLIGEHIDYNDGYVLPAAINRELCMAAHFNAGDQCILHSEQTNQKVVLDLHSRNARRGDWTDYIMGVVHYWTQLGATPIGFELSIASDIPLGAGLSSSAALEVATATLLEKGWNLPLKPVEKALACQQVECDYVGMPCGVMDQMIVTLGQKDHFLLIDCLDHSTTAIPVPDDFPSLLIINSNVRHTLTDGGYATRREQSQSALKIVQENSWRDVTMEKLDAFRPSMTDVQYRRGKHVVGEIDRTLKACESIRNGQMQQLGHLLYASHASLRHDYEVSCAELDWIVDFMQGLGQPKGVWGYRITGGGFGGCAIGLVDSQQIDAVIQKLKPAYIHAFGIQPDFFVTHPSYGCLLEPYQAG